MPTPMFKVLAQSLRLGQPPDATTAVRVLVEVLEKQQADLDDLRSKLSIASSRLQYAEARLARLLEVAEGEAPHAEPPAPSHRSAPPRAPEPARGSQRPPAIPAAPPIPKAPRMPTIRPQTVPEIEAPSILDSGFDEFNQTLVIHKRDLDQVAQAEAPFPLAPASERPRAPTSQGTPFQPMRASERPGPPTSQATPFQAAPDLPPPRQAMVSDPATNAMDADDLVKLHDDDGDGSTVTGRMVSEFAEQAARRERRGRGEE